jgi:hypothetical protein
LSIVAALAAIALGVPAIASAEVVLHEDFESGAPGWSQGGLWHVKNNPQTVSVAPAINPELVSLPDPGQLPSAVSGTHAAWYGEDSSGTFCSGYQSVTQTEKNGCESNGPNSGRLVSPSFSLVGAQSAQVAFNAWWEIEAVNADNFDLIKVEYSTDGGSSWQSVGNLNPVNNPAGQHFETYSNNGLAVSPSWHTYVASLTGAAGHANVRVAFTFDTVDSLYQGFRGVLIDDVDVATPFAADAPQIAAVDPTCVSSTATNQVVAVTGTNFALGSKLFLDGSEVSGAATLSSKRMEFTVSNLAAGGHVIRIVGPLGAASNVATLTSAANCAAQPVAPPAPGGGHAGNSDLRPTATQVICNRGPNPGDPSVCTATVGDAAAPPRPNPTGSVVFTSTNGSFPMGDRCTLRRHRCRRASPAVPRPTTRPRTRASRRSSPATRAVAPTPRARARRASSSPPRPARTRRSIRSLTVRIPSPASAGPRDRRRPRPRSRTRRRARRRASGASAIASGTDPRSCSATASRSARTA